MDDDRLNDGAQYARKISRYTSEFERYRAELNGVMSLMAGSLEVNLFGYSAKAYCGK